MKQLRPYQQEAVERLEGHIMFESGEVILEAPTSFGKSMVIAELVRMFPNAIVLTNITKLIYQTSNLFDELDIGHTLLKANLKKEPKIESEDVIIAMQQTLASRKHLKPNCDLLIVDERHISFGSKTMLEIEQRLKPKNIVGLSATPYTAEGYALPNVDIVTTATINDLTEQGFLCPLDTYVANFSERLDFADVDVGANGDYNEVQLAEIINTDAYNREVVSNWESVCQDKKTIVFASGVAHADALRDMFLTFGYMAGSVHSKQSDEKNQEIMDKFKIGEIKILCSMNQLTTGFSEEDIEVGIICRPTKVRRLWSQCVGRIMRTHPTKERGIILDFGQCTKEFGLYNEVYEPPKYGDKSALIVAKDKAKLDGIAVFLNEENKPIAKINRESVVATLQEIKANALNRRDAKTLIMLFEQSTDLHELLGYVAKIQELKSGDVTKPSTLDWIEERWHYFINSESIYPEAKNIKAFKTRAKNIVRDGKKLSSLYYFANFLRDSEQNTPVW